MDRRHLDCQAFSLLRDLVASIASPAKYSAGRHCDLLRTGSTGHLGPRSRRSNAQPCSRRNRHPACWTPSAISCDIDTRQTPLRARADSSRPQRIRQSVSRVFLQAELESLGLEKMSFPWSLARLLAWTSQCHVLSRSCYEPMSFVFLQRLNAKRFLVTRTTARAPQRMHAALLRTTQVHWRTELGDGRKMTTRGVMTTEDDDDDTRTKSPALDAPQER